MTIKTKPATAEYRDGYDRVFSKKQPPSEEAAIVDRVADATLAAMSTDEYRARAKRNYDEGLHRIRIRDAQPKAPE